MTPVPTSGRGGQEQEGSLRYRVFVVSPPRLLIEEPQLTHHVVGKAIDSTFSRGPNLGEVDSVETRRLRDGRLRVEVALSRGPSVSRAPTWVRAAVARNLDAAAKAVERDGITYFFPGVPLPRALARRPELREPVVRGAIERAFPEVVGRPYRLDLDLRRAVDPLAAASDDVLDVTLTANARSGLEGRDDDARYLAFDRHLADSARGCETLWREPSDGTEDREDEDGGTPRVCVPIAVPLGREQVRPLLDGGGRVLAAAALERTFPELRDAEYGFDYGIGEGFLQITLSAEPRPAVQPDAEAWQVSLGAAAAVRAAAFEAHLGDVVRQAEGGDRARDRAFSR